jgi:hypothetical protein
VAAARGGCVDAHPRKARSKTQMRLVIVDGPRYR